jgi:hypothetical protein
MGWPTLLPMGSLLMRWMSPLISGHASSYWKIASWYWKESDDSGDSGKDEKRTLGTSRSSGSIRGILLCSDRKQGADPDSLVQIILLVRNISNQRTSGALIVSLQVSLAAVIGTIWLNGIRTTSPVTVPLPSCMPGFRARARQKRTVT